MSIDSGLLVMLVTAAGLTHGYALAIHHNGQPNANTLPDRSNQWLVGVTSAMTVLFFTSALINAISGSTLLAAASTVVLFSGSLIAAKPLSTTRYPVLVTGLGTCSALLVVLGLVYLWQWLPT